MQLGWIDFSREQRNKVLSVIHLLSEPTAVDELGVGAIRDGFADIFFPGTSTIQTRAKYFLLVPYIFSELEQSGNLRPDAMLELLHDRELDFIDILLKNSPLGTSGVIGEDAGRSLKRKPSEIYWNGLRTYGIFRGNRMSIAEYCRLICLLRDQKKGAAALGNARVKDDENEADDSDALATGLAGGFWRTPPPPKNRGQELSIGLTGEEASFLRERILKSIPESMLAFVLASNRREFASYADFDELAAMLPALPESLASDYRMARVFMNFIYGAYIRYNMILSRGEDDYCREEWERWESEMPGHAAIDLNAMYARIERRGARIDSRLQHFLARLQSDIRSGDLEQMDLHITEREIQLKGKSRSKLHNAAGFDYRGWVGIGKLVYRLYSAQRIANDIFEGEDGGNA